jgi:hypothetical protein
MQTGFHDIVSATVRNAKASSSLLWADQIADRIAAATPIPVSPAVLAAELAFAAIREGVPVSIPRDRSAPRRGSSPPTVNSSVRWPNGRPVNSLLTMHGRSAGRCATTLPARRSVLRVRRGTTMQKIVLAVAAALLTSIVGGRP